MEGKIPSRFIDQKPGFGLERFSVVGRDETSGKCSITLSEVVAGCFAQPLSQIAQKPQAQACCRRHMLSKRSSCSIGFPPEGHRKKRQKSTGPSGGLS